MMHLQAQESVHARDRDGNGGGPRRPVTTPERKALLFLAAIALLGAGARLAADRGADATAPLTRGALAAQLDAVDSARTAARARRQGAKQGRKPAASRRGARGKGKAAAAPSGPVDVDVADSAALEALPGIGPALAARIVAERSAGGAFGSPAGLERVRGIGPALARKLAPHVTFSGIPRPPNAADGSRARESDDAAPRRRGRRP
jgi:competence protein ComEA